MAADRSPNPPPLHRDPGVDVSGGGRAVAFITAVAICLVVAIFGAAAYSDAKRQKAQEARQHEQSVRETAACVEAGGLPHHDYRTGLILRCDR